MMSMRSLISITLALAFGLTILWFGTDGFRAYTAEGARRVAIQEQPRDIPDVLLEDQDSNEFKLTDYKGKIVLATFMYASCADICPPLEMSLKEVYQSLPKEALGKEVVLVSISFDPERDNPTILQHHAHQYGADGVNWRVSRIADSTRMDQLLDTFEVIVIPNEYGGYEHNGAIHMIGRDGKLIEIFDYENPTPVINKVKTLL